MVWNFPCLCKPDDYENSKLISLCSAGHGKEKHYARCLMWLCQSNPERSALALLTWRSAQDLADFYVELGSHNKFCGGFVMWRL